MRILITTDLYKPSINGVVTSISNLIDELEKLGHDVRVLTVSDRKYSYYKDRVYHLKSLPLKLYPNTRLPITFGRRYLKEIIEWQPHIVHSQCEFFSFEYAEYVSKMTGAVLVHTYHTLYEQYLKYIFNGKIIRKGLIAGFSSERLRKVRAIIAPTPKVELQLRNYGCTNAIEVIPTGINLDRFLERITPEKRMSLRKSWGIPEDAPLLISIGRLGFEKSINELIDGFALVLKQLPEAYFLIVGDGPAKESLMEQAKTLGIESRVIFSGMIKYDDIPSYYQLGDLFACASTSEAQGLTYVEAAASGLALLCREDPCLTNVVDEGENGYAYADLDFFVKKAVELLKDKAFLEHAKEYNKKIAQKFGKEQFGISVSNLYDSVWKATQFDDADKTGILAFLKYFTDSKS